MQYVILANFVILITLGIRHLYLGYRFGAYMKKNIRMERWLHKEEDIAEPELIRLKAKTKNATNAAASAMLLTVLFWILYLVIQVVRAGH